MVLLAILAMVLLIPATGYADDDDDKNFKYKNFKYYKHFKTGVVEINQWKALKGRVTPSDRRGFPVTIDTPGSYRLTSNLTLTLRRVDAIEITAVNVTLDLNGFSIIGPGTGRGVGIRAITGPPAGESNVNVINGSVVNMGGDGLQIGVAAQVNYVNALRNGGNGIVTFGGSNITNSIANRNSGSGIVTGDGCTVTVSKANNNGGNGIDTGSRCTITNNTANSNGGGGIYASDDSVISGNSASYNSYGDGIYAEARSTMNGNAANYNGRHGIRVGPRSSAIGNVANINGSDGLHFIGRGSGYSNNILNGNYGSNVWGNATKMGKNICGGSLCP